MDKRKDDFKIILTIKHLNNDESNLSLECSKRNIKDTSIHEQLFYEAIKHVCNVISHANENDKYFDLEKFIEDNEKIMIKFLLDESK